MRDVSINVSNNDKDDYHRSFVEVDRQSPLSLVVMGSVAPSVCDVAATNISICSDKLLQNVHDLCRYGSDFESISLICDGIFLQSYTIKSGYKLTDNFLSILNQLKIKFIDKVNSTLLDSHDIFLVLMKDLEGHCDVTYLINKYCYAFYKYEHGLVSKFVDILQCDVIPATIQTIFDSIVIDDNCERKMTYIEMEQLFLYFVSSLEKLVKVNIAEYWRNFCNRKKDLLSLITDVDFSSKFVCVGNLDKINESMVNCPSSFTNKFGECLSFMAVAKIDEMTCNFIDKCDDVLAEAINYKCFYVCNYSCKACDFLRDLRNELRGELRDEFKTIIEEEFNKRMREEKINDRFTSFLNNLIIWSKNDGTEVNRALILDNIIDHMRSLLIYKLTSNSYKIVKCFQIGMSKRILSKKRTSLSKKLPINFKSLNELENKWGLMIHPEIDYKISSIRKKFYDKSKNVIKSKFCAMLNEGYQFLDGTVIDVFSWDRVSKNLFPIAHETLRHLVDDEQEELSKVLSSALIVEDVCVFDGCSAGTRSITVEEIERILKISTDRLYSKNITLSSRVWKDLISGKDIDISKEDNYVSKAVISGKDKISVVNNTVYDGNSLVSASSLQNDELPMVVSVGLLSKRDKMISMWGLSLHPDDDKLISFIIRKFSVKIRGSVNELFSGVLESIIIPRSNMTIRDFSWYFVSSGLFEMAEKSVITVVESLHAELRDILSRVRIVDFCENDNSSCRIRKVTDDEKNHLSSRSKKIIDKRLKDRIRRLWTAVVDKHLADIGYSYKSKYKDDYEVVTECGLGVNLCHKDNIAILNVRNKFLSKIRDIVCGKFTSMLINKHKFDDGTYVGLCAWFRISKKLFPIAKEEVRSILKEERKELEETISKSRVVIDLCNDRELTVEENNIVLEKVTRHLDDSLKKICRKAWYDVIVSLSCNYIDTVDFSITSPDADGIDVLNLSADVSVITELSSFSNSKGDVIKVRLCHEDDNAILDLRRKFSSKIYSYVGNKFREMLKERYIFNDGTIIGACPWRYISKRILPIIKEGIDPILEKERKKISDILLKSRVDVYSLDDSSTAIVARELTCDEQSAVMETVMKNVHKKIEVNLGKIWNKVIKLLPSVFLLDLREVDRSELNNIRLEFIGSLVTIVNEVIDFMSSDADSAIDDKKLNVFNTVYERGCNLFNEGGFINRVKLLLSEAKAVDKFGKDRSITDEERQILFREFMDDIDSDRYYLINKRVGKLKSIFITT
ncbi:MULTISPECIES: hypothetical protein [Candidatus Ichthyocystis]|nr:MULTISPECIES: hypothetical protein [Ichthyocystis]